MGFGFRKVISLLFFFLVLCVVFLWDRLLRFCCPGDVIAVLVLSFSPQKLTPLMSRWYRYGQLHSDYVFECMSSERLLFFDFFFPKIYKYAAVAV